MVGLPAERGAMTKSNHRGGARSRRGAPAAREASGAVEIGRGVRMSCHEVGDDLALIRFLCPPAGGGQSRKPRLVSKG